MKKSMYKVLTVLLPGLLLCGQPLAQTPVSVGSGSYASAIPGAENVPTDNTPLKVLPGTPGPYPTNDWWTPLIIKPFSEVSNYTFWAQPLALTVHSYGLGFHFPTEWGANVVAGDNATLQGFVNPLPLRVGGTGFTANDQNVKDWGDWTVTFRISESGSEYMDVTMGHGMPLTWIEYSGVSVATVATDGGVSYFTESGVPSFPFTGDHVGLSWQGRDYGIFTSDGSSFSVSSGQLNVSFGSGQYLVVAALPDQGDLATFQQYAYAVPRQSTVSWDYDQENGKVNTTWDIATQALKGSNSSTIQGFLPHHYKYTQLGFGFNGINYDPTPRGRVQCATGNSFAISYDFNGVLSHLPAPEVFPGKPNGYNSAQLDTYMDTFVNSILYLGETNTYGSGKSLTKWARFLAQADELGHSTQTAIQNKLRTGLENWFSYTPGEPHTYYARMPNFGALMGFDTGFGSEQFNDHHFHYGYHVYAAGILGLLDQDFVNQYGDMARLVAKEYANWDRMDTNFPLFRTLDLWEGHSWANGGFGPNPPLGNNQESTSEAMMSWAGIILLGQALGDPAMIEAGAFGYVTEAAGTYEYWFDRDNENLPPDFDPPLSSITHGGFVEHKTFFGAQAHFTHAIQYIPVLPSSYYLVQNDNFAAAQSEFDWFINESLSRGDGNIGDWGDEWNNIVIRYASLFNPDFAASQQGALGNDAGEAGLTYYVLHSNRYLGKRRFDYHIGAPNSGVFYNAGLNQFTYCVYNSSGSAQSFNVYQNGNVVGSITAPANDFYSTHSLGGTNPNTPPVVEITSPADNASYTAPASITIQASASDSDGSVDQVRFYQGAVLLGSDETSPYSFTWQQAPAGNYTLTAVATDNDDATTTSAPVDIEVNPGSSGSPIPGKIEAEDYTAMNGIQTEATTDEGGGINVGWIDAGDWMDYFVNVSSSGSYQVDFRVASLSGGGVLELRSGSTPLASINIDATNGWQNWVTLSDEADLSAGGQTLRLYAVSGGFNVNWVEFTEGSSGTGCSFEASTGDYSAQVSSDIEDPTITFLPEVSGVGSTTCILYYGTSATGTLPGYYVTPNVPYQITASQGQTIYFYYTYSLPQGGENNTNNSRHHFVVGNCGSGSGTRAGSGILSGSLKEGGLSVYPNPAEDKLTISGLKDRGTVSIYDLSGKLLLKNEVSAGVGDPEVNIGALPKGIYLLEISGDQLLRMKILKE